MPSDQDIVLHYEQKAKGKPVKGRPTLQKQTFTCDVPDECLCHHTVNGGENGEEQMQMEQQEVQQEALDGGE